jgi:Putative DNA-binding domain
LTLVPLGQVEGQRLEFKQADVLRELEKVGREVVAMLNAEGGEVWIGLAEDQGRAIRVTPVPDAAREKSRLFDHLIDTIEPRPASELAVDIIPHETGDVLRVNVSSGARRPYAHLKGDARRYVTRVGDRLRALSHDELRQMFKDDERAIEDEEAIAHRKLREARDTRWKETPQPALWLALAVVPESHMNVREAYLRELLVRPELSGNRRDGWACVGGFAEPAFNLEAVVLSAPGAEISTQIRADGGVRVEVALQALHWKGAERELWPLALIEYVVSAFRLARSVHEATAPPPQAILSDFALFGADDWTLRPYSPNAFRYQTATPAQRDAKAHPMITAARSKDLLLPKTLESPWEHLVENADGCAWPIIEQVYQAFGYWPDQIPREFDIQTRRLRMDA